jgi:hypothetical protein
VEVIVLRANVLADALALGVGPVVAGDLQPGLVGPENKVEASPVIGRGSDHRSGIAEPDGLGTVAPDVLEGPRETGAGIRDHDGLLGEMDDEAVGVLGLVIDKMKTRLALAGSVLELLGGAGRGSHHPDSTKDEKVPGDS